VVLKGLAGNKVVLTELFAVALDNQGKTPLIFRIIDQMNHPTWHPFLCQILFNRKSKLCLADLTTLTTGDNSQADLRSSLSQIKQKSLVRLTNLIGFLRDKKIKIKKLSKCGTGHPSFSPDGRQGTH